MGRGWFWVVKFRIAKFIQPEKNCGDRAVLVAISIPIFTSQLEKSRDAVTVANIRAAYAQAASEVLTSTNSGKAGSTLTSDQDVVCKGTQAGLSDLEKELPVDQAGQTYVKDNCGAANATVKLRFTWTIAADGSNTVTIGAAS